MASSINTRRMNRACVCVCVTMSMPVFTSIMNTQSSKQTVDESGSGACVNSARPQLRGHSPMQTYCNLKKCKLVLLVATAATWQHLDHYLRNVVEWYKRTGTNHQFAVYRTGPLERD